MSRILEKITDTLDQTLGTNLSIDQLRLLATNATPDQVTHQAFLADAKSLGLCKKGPVNDLNTQARKRLGAMYRIIQGDTLTLRG